MSGMGVFEYVIACVMSAFVGWYARDWLEFERQLRRARRAHEREMAAIRRNCSGTVPDSDGSSCV